MKNVFTVLLIPVAIAVLANLPGCYQSSEKVIERVPCTHDLHDYQIELTNNYILVYDGDRLLGRVEHGNTKLDSIFNQLKK
jgi:hypothetical protein